MKPILFSTTMIQAIMAGRKIQTRRVMRPQPKGGQFTGYATGDELGRADKNFYAGFKFSGQKSVSPLFYKSPYMRGDLLWVRETWTAPFLPFNMRPSDMPEGTHIVYRADEPEASYRWRPSIFMPRWASRIILKVEDIRVERLQDATLNDLIAEGCPAEYLPDNCNGMSQAVHGWFEHLWDGLNDARGYGWRINPWVWVIEFSILELG